MKANSFFISILILLTSSLVSIPLYAQENLDKWMKKCESNKSTDISIHTHNQSNDSYKSTEVITQIKITNNQELYNEFINAFEKDKANAKDVMEKRINGVIKPSFCEFQTNKSEKEIISTIYSINFDKSTDFSVSKIHKTTSLK